MTGRTYTSARRVLAALPASPNGCSSPRCGARGVCSPVLTASCEAAHPERARGRGETASERAYRVKQNQPAYKVPSLFKTMTHRRISRKRKNRFYYGTCRPPPGPQGWQCVTPNSLCKWGEGRGGYAQADHGSQLADPGSGAYGEPRERVRFFEPGEPSVETASLGGRANGFLCGPTGHLQQPDSIRDASTPPITSTVSQPSPATTSDPTSAPPSAHPDPRQ